MSTASLSKPGTLVRARDREWVVLPDSTDELLILRPLGGLDEEVAGVLPAIESVKPAIFPLPTMRDIGDFTSGRLLRDAARISTRSAAGPFRSFGRIAVEPRPYQLVPLMMALQLDPVRMLIADDVGIGKTIEAGLIVRELLDRGEVKHIAVLCPPYLARQWQHELSEKFNIDAELVLSGTIKRLERDLPIGASVFESNRFTVVSTDFIKTPARARDFALKCPECVIVDEAHGCTLAKGVGRGSQQRHELLRKIAADGNRHMILVTATPHNGNEDAFRSLLSLLDEDFANLPTDLDLEEREGARRRLARHLVQRRRGDIRRYLEIDTSFPKRRDKEITYSFHSTYRNLFETIISFAHTYVTEVKSKGRKQRVRYWSALALLRCVSSSPAAAIATLRNRAAVDRAEEDNVDEIGRRSVLDHSDADDSIILDFSPGADSEDTSDTNRRKLLEFARHVKALNPASDHKLQGAITEIKSLLGANFRPVIFCRFIETAEYVAHHLRNNFPSTTKVESVTGVLPPAEREARIESLVAEGGQYVLVCTDCLSEGINLQNHFDAVFHYDMAWNPTRHEQREGRIDRFGQKKAEVRVVTYYGEDNPIDGVILDVLIRKHKNIKSTLGIAVAVPGSSEQIAETLFKGALFRQRAGSDGRQLSLQLTNGSESQKKLIHAEWDNMREREKASRSRFAQHALSPEAVAAELANVRVSIGSAEDVEHFVCSVLQMANIPTERVDKTLKINLNSEAPRSLRQAIGIDVPFVGRFDLPLLGNEVYLGRTSPIVEGLAGWTLDLAIDPIANGTGRIAARCGVISTSAVENRVTLLIARFRFQLKTMGRGRDRRTLLCEEILPVVFMGPSNAPRWLEAETGELLLDVKADRNLLPTAIEQQMKLLLPSMPNIQKSLEPLALDRAALQANSHERVRKASKKRGRVVIDPVLPVDILGAYTILSSLS